VTLLFLIITHKFTLILTGVIIIGEALALYIGTSVLREKNEAWIGSKNRAFIWLDIVAGLGLVWSAAQLDTNLGTFVYAVMLASSSLAHAYREWEFFYRRQNRFCMNTPLLVMNTLKLLGLALIIILRLSIVFI